MIKDTHYGYDPLNRITSATSNDGNFDVSNITYDKMGNIMSLQRQGHIVDQPVVGTSGHYGVMDNLSYEYDSGNKLIKVTDSGNTTYGFKDGANQAVEYTYDTDGANEGNGNLTSDANKGITNIDYNHLNLPTKVTIANSQHNGTIDYVYDATGVKLKKTITDPVNGDSEMLYAGGYVYQGGKLQFLPHAEGYLTPKNLDDLSQGFDYVYQFKDHLDNVRLSYTDSDPDPEVEVLETIEENHFYPFGLKMRGFNELNSALGSSVAERWKYNGQENEEVLGLNVTEMTFRQYDPAIARFIGIDIMAEDFGDITPYHYGNNNPIAFNDPTGLFSTYVNKEGEIIKHIDDNDPNIYLVADENSWDGTNRGLQVIGREQGGRQYIKGEYLYSSDLFQDIVESPNSLPSGFLLKIEIGDGGGNFVFWPAEILSGGTLFKIGNYWKYLNSLVKYKKLLKNSKFLKQMEKQLRKDGGKSIRKTYNKLKRRIREHKDALDNGGYQYTSSVEREIRTWEKNIKELEVFMRKHKIDF